MTGISGFGNLPRPEFNEANSLKQYGTPEEYAKAKEEYSKVTKHLEETIAKMEIGIVYFILFVPPETIKELKGVIDILKGVLDLLKKNEPQPGSINQH